jgi:hypothetical protein
MSENTNQARSPSPVISVIQPGTNTIVVSPYYDFDPAHNSATRWAYGAGKEVEENEWLRRKLATAGQLGRQQFATIDETGEASSTCLGNLVGRGSRSSSGSSRGLGFPNDELGSPTAVSERGVNA